MQARLVSAVPLMFSMVPVLASTDRFKLVSAVLVSTLRVPPTLVNTGRLRLVSAVFEKKNRPWPNAVEVDVVSAGKLAAARTWRSPPTTRPA